MAHGDLHGSTLRSLDERQSGTPGGVFFERGEVDSGHVVAVLILDLARHHGPVLAIRACNA